MSDYDDGWNDGFIMGLMQSIAVINGNNSGDTSALPDWLPDSVPANFKYILVVVPYRNSFVDSNAYQTIPILVCSNKELRLTNSYDGTYWYMTFTCANDDGTCAAVSYNLNGQVVSIPKDAPLDEWTSYIVGTWGDYTDITLGTRYQAAHGYSLINPPIYWYNNYDVYNVDGTKLLAPKNLSRG